MKDRLSQGDRLLAPNPADHVRNGVGVKVFSHVLTDGGPHGEQDALPLVVAGAPLVRLTKITDDDRAVDSSNNLAQGELVRRVRQHVPATYTALGTDQASALQG